jgi:hypothetical protein
MLHEPSMIVPPPPQRMEVPALIPPPLTTALAPPTPEQVRAVDAVFTANPGQAEAHAVEGLICLWSGTLLLHDLAREHFGKARDREDEQPPRLDGPPANPRG